MIELYPFQRKGVRLIHERFKGVAYLADQMGLGKTIQTLAYIDQHLDLNDGPIIVVCPASVKWNWRYEARKHIGLQSYILQGRKAKLQDRGAIRRAKMVIINYEILQYWVKHLVGIKPQLIVIDEAQKCKNPRAKCTKATKRIARKTKRRLALSGTPILNYPAEAFPILNMLRPDMFPTFFPFAVRYCAPKRTPWGWEYRGASHTEELNQLLKTTCMIRRTKQQVMKQLPSKIRQVLPMQLPPKRLREYKDAENAFAYWLQRTARMPDPRERALQARTRVNNLKVLIGELKMELIKGWIDDFLATTNEKLLVFGIHHKVLKPLHKMYADQSVLVNGEVIGKQRQMLFDKFNHHKDTRLMFGNLIAAGVGWNCTSTANVAFVEMGWTPGDHSQAEDRVHGLKRGTGARVQVYYLVANGTIEQKLCRVLEEKQQVIDATVDGKAQKGSMDVFSILMNHFTKARRA